VKLLFYNSAADVLLLDIPSTIPNNFKPFYIGAQPLASPDCAHRNPLRLDELGCCGTTHVPMTHMLAHTYTCSLCFNLGPEQHNLAVLHGAQVQMLKGDA
jgi:hypothetical protein